MFICDRNSWNRTWYNSFATGVQWIWHCPFLAVFTKAPSTRHGHVQHESWAPGKYQFDVKLYPLHDSSWFFMLLHGLHGLASWSVHIPSPLSVQISAASLPVWPPRPRPRSSSKSSKAWRQLRDLQQTMASFRSPRGENFRRLGPMGIMVGYQLRVGLYHTTIGWDMAGIIYIYILYGWDFKKCY